MGTATKPLRAAGQNVSSDSLLFQVSLAEIISHSSITQDVFPIGLMLGITILNVPSFLSFSRMAAVVEVPQTKDLNFFFKNRN